MLPDRITTSICPTCYRTIPAAISVRGESVFIYKACPDHGNFTAMVERDAEWWKVCQALGCTNIYDGYMIDVTDRCNLSCRYCYHSNGSNDRTAEDIVAEAVANKHLAPIILTGGEPTMHDDLPAIIRGLAGIETWVLTNGVRMCDEAYLDELCKAGLLYGNTLLVGLSFHKESDGKDLELLELCRRKGLTIGTAFWVIDDLDQMEEAMATYSAYRDVILSLRIKAASNLWAEGGAQNHIFVSDMYRWLYERGPTRLLTDHNNKVSFADVMHNELHVMLVSWYDAGNVDLQDINCGPWYRANDGTVNNLVTTGLINEGVRHGKVL